MISTDLAYQHRIEFLNRFSWFLISLVMLIAGLVLTGWSFNIELLKRLVPQFVAMNPLTAVCFILSGLCFIFRELSSRHKTLQTCSLVFAALILLVGFLRLTDYSALTHARIDKILFAGKLDDNQMAPNTAFNFILLGAAFLSLQFSRRLAILFTVTISLISILAILGYAYGVRAFYGVASYIPMALHTAGCFFCLCLSLFFVHSERGLMGEITSADAGGIMARRLLPIAVLFIPALGWLKLSGAQAHWFSIEFGVALMVSLIVAVLVSIILATAHQLNQVDHARKEFERRQNELLIKVESINRELNNFAYVVSHDLKAPLRGIASVAAWIESDEGEKISAAGKENLTLLQNRIRRMHNLIEGILNYSRIGRDKEEKRLTDLNPLVREAIDMASPPASAQIDVETSFPTLVIEPTLIHQVFQNLISNAIKFNDKPEGRIKIGCQDGGSHWNFYVEDNGPGIEEKHFEKIFLIFQTLNPRDTFESTGIGLSIVKKIVDGHGGKVSVSSRIGEKTIFTFSLPKN